MATIANGISQPVCQNCSTSTTPLWRRDESGSVLCNACGLFLKLHGTPRPISLKTDVIKSRNRVKIAGQQGQKRKVNAPNFLIVCREAYSQSIHMKMAFLPRNPNIRTSSLHNKPHNESKRMASAERTLLSHVQARPACTALPT